MSCMCEHGLGMWRACQLTRSDLAMPGAKSHALHHHDAFRVTRQVSKKRRLLLWEECSQAVLAALSTAERVSSCARHCVQGPFDAAFFNAVFENVFDQREALLRASLLLTPGGPSCVPYQPAPLPPSPKIPAMTDGRQVCICLYI